MGGRRGSSPIRKNLPGCLARISGEVSIFTSPSIRCAMVDLVRMRSISCIFSSSSSSARSDTDSGWACSFMAYLLAHGPARPLRPHQRWRGSRCSGSNCRKDARGLFAAGDAALLQKFLCGQDHGRRAEAALQSVALLEGQLQVGDLAGVRHTLDGFDLGAVALRRQHQAAAHDLAVHPHGAGAADAVLAADMTPGHEQVVAQEIDQRLARIHALTDGLAVDGEGNVEDVVAHNVHLSWPGLTRPSRLGGRSGASSTGIAGPGPAMTTKWLMPAPQTTARPRAAAARRPDAS